MKKSLLALAVLASAAGAANAASSVTMYGRVDVGYEDVQKNGASVTQNGSSAGDSRFGIKGQEDLGNGLAATFQLEGAFGGDTGAFDGDFFRRESTVGLKGNFGHVRLGKSKSAMERGLGDYNVGERVATYWDSYSSGTRHSNGLFYDYAMNGFNFGADVTTKGGAAGASEGVSGSKIGYGVHAGYTVGGLKLNAAYQADRNGSTNDAATIANGYSSNGIPGYSFNADKEWGVGASYTFAPVTVGLSYADAKGTSTYSTNSSKVRTMNAFVSGDITSNDSVYLKFMQKKASTYSAQSTKVSDKINMWGVGYSHALSKRTSIYADVARYKQTGLSSRTAYDVALRHAF